MTHDFTAQRKAARELAAEQHSHAVVRATDPEGISPSEIERTTTMPNDQDAQREAARELAAEQHAATVAREGQQRGGCS